MTHHDCTSLKLSLLFVVQHKLLWLSGSFHPYRDIPSRKGKYSVSRTNTKPCQIIKHAEISYSTVSIVFHKFLCGTYQNSQNQGTSKPYLKAEVLQVPQKVWITSVWYLLMGIRILVYSCTEWGTSEIYLYLKDNNISFYRVSLKSETKDTRP